MNKGALPTCRVSALARSRARDAKELERDRVLNPDKYKRVHRYMRGMYGQARYSRNGSLYLTQLAPTIFSISRQLRRCYVLFCLLLLGKRSFKR